MPEFVLIFDIPTEMSVLKVKINRALKLINATMVQRSVWKSKNKKDLVSLALWIRQHGGKADVIQWKSVL